MCPFQGNLTKPVGQQLAEPYSLPLSMLLPSPSSLSEPDAASVGLKVQTMGHEWIISTAFGQQINSHKVISMSKLTYQPAHQHLQGDKMMAWLMDAESPIIYFY